MNALHVSLFGRFDVRSGQQFLTGFEARKVQELFCYLLLYRDRPHPREALANLLWDEQHTDQPGRCLRKTLWQLRSALDSNGEALSGSVLFIESDWVQLNPEADLRLDVAEFEQAFHRSQHLPGDELDPPGVQALVDAICLYRGGLQESWYQDWYLYERERFQHMYLAMLEKLMDHCEAQGDYSAGLAYGALILNCEKARERTHRRLMRLHYLAGDRTAALRQYEHCVHALAEELGVAPASRTVALYQQIECDQLSLSASGPVEAASRVPESSSSWPLMLHRLKRLQATLADVQREIGRDIRALELALNGQDPPTHPE
jgi:DNA-binding SARP family transcriptional activator